MLHAEHRLPISENQQTVPNFNSLHSRLEVFSFPDTKSLSSPASQSISPHQPLHSNQTTRQKARHPYHNKVPFKTHFWTYSLPIRASMRPTTHWSKSRRFPFKHCTKSENYKMFQPFPKPSPCNANSYPYSSQVKKFLRFWSPIQFVREEEELVLWYRKRARVLGISSLLSESKLLKLLPRIETRTKIESYWYILPAKRDLRDGDVYHFNIGFPPFFSPTHEMRHPNHHSLRPRVHIGLAIIQHQTLKPDVKLVNAEYRCVCLL